MKDLSKRLDSLGPLFLTLFLIVWTACVYHFSHYGDNWAILPALFVFPSAVLWHCALIAYKNPKGPFIVYAVVHLVILLVIWAVCLTLIGKSSL